MAESLLDAEFVEHLEYLYIVIRTQFVGRVSARRVSKRFGVGTEFTDHRPYTAGDDFRYIDWAAFARRDDLVIKLFTEEQATHLYFVLDASRSMELGKPSKLLFAKKIAAALAYVGLANADPVTILSFDERLRPVERSFQGRAQSRRMMAHLDSIEAGGDRTGMSEAFREFVRGGRSRNRGLVVLLSDFLDAPGFTDAISLLHHHRYAMLAVRVNEREEISPSVTGDLELVDTETQQRLQVKVSPALLASYHQRLEAHYAELERLCRIMQRSYVPAVSDMKFDDLILDVFRRQGFLR